MVFISLFMAFWKWKTYESITWSSCPEILESFLMKPWISGRPVTKFASLLDSFDAGELIFNKQSKSETDKKQ